MKKIILIASLSLFVMNLFSQKRNILLQNDFWKSQPSVEQIKKVVDEENDPTAMNNRSFDPTAMAILADAPFESIKYILSLNNDKVNTITHDGRTYIFWAAVKGNLPVIKYLIDKGAKADLEDAHGLSVINFAANKGVQNKKLYNYLIQQGADVKATTHNGANALLIIAPNLQNESMIDYFQSKGLDINSNDNNGNGIFNYAAKGGHIEMMAALIKRGVDYKGLNKNGENAILVASQGTRRSSPSLATFKFLESKGINPDITSKAGFTPLHYLSIRNNDIEVFKYFINKGVNPNQQDAEGNTALMNAAKGNTIEVIKFLAGKTNNIKQANNKGQTVLSNAIQKNSAEVVQFLINQGADINREDKAGNNLIYYLVESANGRGAMRRDSSEPNAVKPEEEKLNLLIKNGLDIKKAQYNGNSLLHMAVEHNNMFLTQKALNLGVSINAKNNEGNTPLQIAALKAIDNKIMKLLVNHGADKTLKTDFDETAYDLAKENEVLMRNDVNVEFLKK